MSNSNQTEKPEVKGILTMKAVNADDFSRYTTETGRILPRRITHLSAKEQRHLTREVKRSRNLLLAK